MTSPPSSLKTLNSLHLFSIKPPSPSPSSPSLSSMKLKTLLQTFIFSHLCRVAGALSRAKSVLLQLLKDTHLIHLLIFRKNKDSGKQQKKIFFGSFRLHYNWCSSTHHHHPNYDATWKVSEPLDYDDSNELSKYLQWLEEKGDEEEWSNEIDKLADLFIANCHEKFRLEKQESYRRFQEMMARSV